MNLRSTFSFGMLDCKVEVNKVSRSAFNNVIDVLFVVTSRICEGLRDTSTTLA